MSIATEIKALERRIKSARERGKLKEAGEMSRVRSTLRLQAKKKKKSKKNKLKIA